MPPADARLLPVVPPFSLAATCGPVAWADGRWPNVDWRDDALIWVGWEDQHLGWREVRQIDDQTLLITGTADRRLDALWAERVLGVGTTCPAFDDDVVEVIRRRYPGMRPFAHGSLFDGLLTSIVGQSISVASAAVTLRRLAACFSPPIEAAGRTFWALPRPAQLAEAPVPLVRESGVTWRRADALVAAARAALDLRRFPTDAQAIADPDAARAVLRLLPLVGPWTAESTLLWGLGLPDAHPTGDVALLRAARRTYDEPALDLRGLDRLAEGWHPARGWAARLLWTDLLGPAGRGVAAS